MWGPSKRVCPWVQQVLCYSGQLGQLSKTLTTMSRVWQMPMLVKLDPGAKGSGSALKAPTAKGYVKVDPASSPKSEDKDYEQPEPTDFSGKAYNPHCWVEDANCPPITSLFSSWLPIALKPKKWLSRFMDWLDVRNEHMPFVDCDHYTNEYTCKIVECKKLAKTRRDALLSHICKEHVEKEIICPWVGLYGCNKENHQLFNWESLTSQVCCFDMVWLELYQYKF